MKRFLRWLNFNLWYLGKPRWDTGISPPELFELIESHPVGRAIDLGCGTGTNALTLAQRGWRVVGVDFVPRAIRLARQKARRAGLPAGQVEFRVADVSRLEGVAPPFDLALDIGCFHGVADKSAYLRELNRLLAPGGIWLLYAFFQPEAEGTSPGLTKADLQAIAAAGLTPLRLVDGFDRFGRASAWMTYQKPRQP